MNDSLGFICVTWDDPRGIMRLLQNPDIYKFDYLCFFDGKFEGWEGEREFPEFETKNILKDWSESTGVHVYYEMIKGKTEAQKRNHSLFRSNQIGMKWGLIVDSDEEFSLDRTDFDLNMYLMNNRECHAVSVKYYTQPAQRRPRIVDLKCRPYYADNRHSLIYSGDTGKCISQSITEHNHTVDSIKIWANKSHHTEHRMKAREEFGKVPH